MRVKRIDVHCTCTYEDSIMKHHALFEKGGKKKNGHIMEE
jgi:hypothetical protein